MKKPNPKFTTERLKRVRIVIPPVPKRFKKVKGEERMQEALQNIPRITNETVAEHREDVLRGARKYKYPLQHSKHKIVITSTTLLVLAIVGFFVYAGLSLYRFQSSTSFTYRITQVLPFPVARAGSYFVAYENYLFELRRYEHYYQTQQRVDFGSKDGKRQLNRYKPQALNQVIQAAYVKQLASKNHVKVTDAELNLQIQALQAQNQSSEQELADVTNIFFGWSLKDLRREIGQEILAQKVASAMDTAAHAKAQAALQAVQNGTDFTAVVQQYSDAADKANGGQYANTSISESSTDIPPAVVRELEKLQVGQTTTVIEAGTSLEIVKLTGNANGKMQAAHVSINITPIQTYVSQYTKAHPTHKYISVE